MTIGIDFYFQGAGLYMRVKPAYPLNGQEFVARLDCATEWAARLLQHTINNQLMDRLVDIRREAYEEGWKDAKAKRAKRHRDAFGCHL